MYKKSLHQRHDSGEINVFEASRYFSGATHETPRTFAHKIISEDKESARRLSLDLPCKTMFRHAIQHPTQIEKQTKDKKSHKQPSSPGGRLAHFLNSLFNQTSSKKKKSKSSTKSVKDGEDENRENPSSRRKRRSSISFFQTVINHNSVDSKSIYSSSSSGFRTPPPKRNGDYDEKFRFINGMLEKKKDSNLGFSSRARKNWSDHQFVSKEREFRKINDILNDYNNDGGDGGEDSDSSSDLFDLPNHDLDFYSSGLPVYETTHMSSIKRGAPISISSGII